MLRVSRATLYQRIRTGHLAIQKDGRRSYITVTELHRYLGACNAPTVSNVYAWMRAVMSRFGPGRGDAAGPVRAFAVHEPRRQQLPSRSPAPGRGRRCRQGDGGGASRRRHFRWVAHGFQATPRRPQSFGELSLALPERPRRVRTIVEESFDESI